MPNSKTTLSRTPSVHPTLEKRNLLRCPGLIRRHRPIGQRTVDTLRIGRHTHPRGIIQIDPHGPHALNIVLPEQRENIRSKTESHTASFCSATTLNRAPRIHPPLKKRNPIRPPGSIRRHLPRRNRPINLLRISRDTHPRGITQINPNRFHTFLMSPSRNSGRISVAKLRAI